MIEQYGPYVSEYEQAEYERIAATKRVKRSNKSTRRVKCKKVWRVNIKISYGPTRPSLVIVGHIKAKTLSEAKQKARKLLAKWTSIEVIRL